MDYTFKFNVKQQVVALDYSEPRVAYNGIVVQRWLQDVNQFDKSTEKNEAKLVEHYKVLLFNADDKPQHCEFLVDDLTEVSND